jgi:hypothetical protein
MPQLFEIWLKASSKKPMFMPSTIGRSPDMAAPTPKPIKPFSAREQAEQHNEQWPSQAKKWEIDDPNQPKDDRVCQ